MYMIEDFFNALNQVEAGGKREGVPKGDSGMAIGPLQIHQGAFTDACQHWDLGLKYADCEKWNASMLVACAYFHRYAQRNFRDLLSGKAALRDIERLARIWNGGPTGGRRTTTVEYGEKVCALMEKN